MAAALAKSAGERVLGMIELIDQAAVALGLLERRQVLPLHVFE